MESGGWRVKMVQTMYTYVCKNNILVETIPGIGRGGIKESSERCEFM
jgi:hypothetical protein